MPFEIPDNIHPQCARLAWMLGTWAGNGHGEYPTIEPFQFGQELIFQQDGRPFIHYVSRAWIVDEAGNHVREAAQETGFIRPQEDGTLEVLLAHNTGFVETWHGELHPDQPRFEIATDAVVRDPAHERGVDAALQDEVLEQPSHFVVSEGGNDRRTQPEAPAQPAGHVVLPAALPGAKAARIADAAFSRVEPQHHLAEGHRVIAAVGCRS